MDTVYDIIVLAGQSNAEGNGFGNLKGRYFSKDKIFILEDKNKGKIKFDDNEILQIQPFIPEISAFKEYINPENAKIGNFSLSFASEYIKSGLLQNGRKVLIVYAAVGGTGFARFHWGNNAPLQKRMFNMVDYALSLNKENKIVAFLWHQGEHDAFENADLTEKTRTNFYYEKFGYLVDSFCEKYGKNIPILAGGFSEEWQDTGYRKQCKSIMTATKKVLKAHNGLFINANKLKSNNQEIGNGDNIHFSRQSLYILGKRYFKGFMKLANKRN